MAKCNNNVNCPFWKEYRKKYNIVICEGYYPNSEHYIKLKTEEQFIIQKSMRCNGDFTKCPYWQLTMERYGGKEQYPFKSGISEYKVGAEVDINRYKGVRK